MFTVYLKSAGGTKKYFTEFETEAEELEKALLQLLKKNILQSIELSWMRELEREQRLRGLSR